jgi:hypothetical protein
MVIPSDASLKRLLVGGKWVPNEKINGIVGK